jgi:DnaK suppressor protein
MSIDTPRLRIALIEERRRIEKALESLREEEVEEPAAGDTHMAETATATLDREMGDTLEENSMRMLAQIDDALARVDAGTYGVCVSCGRQIQSERLDAYPWASRCIDCKREAERG